MKKGYNYLQMPQDGDRAQLHFHSATRWQHQISQHPATVSSQGYFAIKVHVGISCSVLFIYIYFKLFWPNLLFLTMGSKRVLRRGSGYCPIKLKLEIMPKFIERPRNDPLGYIAATRHLFK